MKYPIRIDSRYVKTFRLNGLKGRRVELPAPKGKTRNLVLVYGHHPSLERMYSTGEYFNDFGSVLMFDLPGFGGMEPFRKAGLKPTLDNYADYLYTIIKNYKPNEKLTIVGMSFGFMMVTRMLQKYPDMHDRVGDLISFVGFLSGDDFRISQRVRRAAAALCTWLSRPFGGWLIKTLVFNRWSLYVLLSIFFVFNPKMKDVPRAHRKAVRAMETDLWTMNDMQTHFYTTRIMLTENVLVGGRVPLAVSNIVTGSDQYFNNTAVEQHMKEVYKSYTPLVANIAAHAPSILGDKSDVSVMMPPELKDRLNEALS